MPKHERPIIYSIVFDKDGKEISRSVFPLPRGFVDIDLYGGASIRISRRDPGDWLTDPKRDLPWHGKREE